jgi:ABC-2 type transport system ATP-binding protein
MRYGSAAAETLRGASFEVHRGEVVVLLGPNGAGKTTAIEILEGFRARSAGKVVVLGTDPWLGGDDWRARIGVVLQSWRDHRRWRVGELVEQFGRYYRPYSEPGRPRPFPTAALLDQVGLTEQAGKQVGSLSGGQRRRLDVAIGIVGRPELLFLDEPTAGFDPVARREFHDLVRRLAERENTTILLTTHDLAEAEKLAGRILILDQGQIVADGTAQQLARDIAGTTEVSWTSIGERHRETTSDGTGFVRDLLARHGREIQDLEVRRASLEESYLTMVTCSQVAAGRTPFAAAGVGR